MTAGLELFKQKPFLGHGASNRDAIMVIVSEELMFEGGAHEKRLILSWHRYLPVPLRKYYVERSRKIWQENRRKEVKDARARGEPVPKARKRHYQPTYEKVMASEKTNGHLHKEYLMHAVDGGILGISATFALFLVLPTLVR